MILMLFSIVRVFLVVISFPDVFISIGLLFIAIFIAFIKSVDIIGNGILGKPIYQVLFCELCLV